jgi:hypothetical protein
MKALHFIEIVCILLASYERCFVAGYISKSRFGNSYRAAYDRKSLQNDVAAEQTSFPTELNDDVVLTDTKEWVQKVVVDFGVCPFTINKNRAGIPMGEVRYAVSRATTPEEAFIAYWEETQAMLKVSETEISTILLVFPELECFGNYALFEAYADRYQLFYMHILEDWECETTMVRKSSSHEQFYVKIMLST